MKRYEDYKPTGTEWISSIPASWDIQKIGALFAQRKEKVSDKDFAPISVTKNGILPQLATAAKTDDGDNRKKVCVGDFVINSRSDRKGSCGVSDLEGSVSLINIVLQPRDQLSGRYAHYLLRNHLFSEEYYRNGRGIVADLWTTRYSEMKTILLPVPPRAEQDQIVRYLDWQVSKINRLIAAKQHQIELLEQKKMRSIQTAFCKNRSHHSAEDLLGTIKEWLPEDWTSPLLGQVISSIEQGWSPNAGDYVDTLDQWHVLSLSAVKHGLFINTACKPIDINATVPANLELQDGDLLLTRSNTRNLVGDVCLVHNAKPRTIFSDLIYRLVVKQEYALSRYLMYYLLSPFARIQMERAAKGSSGTMPKLSHADIGRIRLVLPPVDIQESICNELDAMSGAIDVAIDKIKTQINHILELRTRLISDVVTGQIDVRGIEVSDYEFLEDTDTREEPEEDTEGEEYEE